jgi:N-acetylneuraminate synthase
MSILNSISLIVELGINHGGSLDIAKKMVDTAISAGATCIKHQTHIPDEEMHPGNRIYDLIASCALSEDDELALKDHIEQAGGIFVSTPFSFAAVDRLESFGVPFYKLASGAPIELINYVCSKGKPVVFSTGMEDFSASLKRCRAVFKHGIPCAVLHTTNLYPTPFNLARLGAIQQFKTTLPTALVGYSDHSTTNHACFAAVALGADIIERHLAHPDVRGPDYKASMKSQADVKDLVGGIENIKQARGGRKTHLAEEQVTRDFALYTWQDGKLRR